MILEICANSYQSAVNAEIAGAHRIELCSEISVGGTTPSYGLLKKVMADIYPKELVLVPEDSEDQSCSFLDLQVVIKDSVITTSIFDKRDAFDFPIINFPTLTGNIPNRSSYGVFIGELVRYSRGCTYYKDFEDRATVLITKLLRQAFTVRGLKAAFFKFIDSHILLAQKYGLRVLSLVDKIHS